MVGGSTDVGGSDAHRARRAPLIPAPPGSTVSVGPLDVHLYGTLIAGGGIVATKVASRQLAHAGITRGIGPSLVVPTVVAGLVGARAYHVATDHELYAGRPLDALKIWNGGLGVYGGIAAGAATAAVMAHRARLPIAPLFDALAVGVPLAQAIGRWGNYANQELVGRPTSMPWGLEVDPGYRPEGYEDERSFHPAFLYESLLNLGVAGGTFALSRRWKGRPAGALAAVYLMGYGVSRFAVESVRADAAKERFGLRTNHWTSIGVAGVGAATLGALTLRAARSAV